MDVRLHHKTVLAKLPDAFKSFFDRDPVYRYHQVLKASFPYLCDIGLVHLETVMALRIQLYEPAADPGI